MPFNKRPIRPVTQEEIDTYKRDGVVCLRQVFDGDWIESLLGTSRSIIVDRKDHGSTTDHAGTLYGEVYP